MLLQSLTHSLSRYREPDRGGARPPWEAPPPRHAGDRPTLGRGAEEDRWGSRSEPRFAQPPALPRGPPRGTADRFSSFDRFGSGDFAADDVELFPPPPPPPPAAAGRGQARSEPVGAAAAATQVDEEREAFFVEVARVAEELARSFSPAPTGALVLSGCVAARVLQWALQSVYCGLERACVEQLPRAGTLGAGCSCASPVRGAGMVLAGCCVGV